MSWIQKRNNFNDNNIFKLKTKIVKQLIGLLTLILSISVVHAQDEITLKTGETITAQVSEVGVNEIKYYKADNLQGPLYVAAKAEVMQIVYKNGSKDVFSSSSVNNVIMQQQPQTVIVQQTARAGYRPVVRFPLFAHIDLGHSNYGYYGGHHRAHHGRHH